MSRHLGQLRVLSLTTMALLLFTACDAAPAPTASPVAAPAAPTAASAAAPTATTAPLAPAAGAGPALKNPDTIVVSAIGELVTLDPAWLYEVASAEVVGNIYETLIAPKREKTS
jgi:ABC-type transport system substrate-binding protein